MTVYNARGVVLRTYKLGEADRIIVFLSPEHGLKRLVAKGVRKPGSRFGARLEPFSVVDVQCYSGRNMDRVTQVVAVRLYGASLVADYEVYQAAAAMSEACLQFSLAEASVKQYQLFVAALNALEAGDLNADIVFSSYLLRALKFAGWQIQIRNCADCQREGFFLSFSIAAGGVLCGSCQAGSELKLTVGQLQLFDALQAGRWESVKNAAPQELKALKNLIIQFYNWHLERKLKSLQRGYAEHFSPGGNRS